MEFIYFSDEWNEEKVASCDTNIPGVDGELKDADSGTKQKKIHKKK